MNQIENKKSIADCRPRAVKGEIDLRVTADSQAN